MFIRLIKHFCGNINRIIASIQKLYTFCHRISLRLNKRRISARADKSAAFSFFFSENAAVLLVFGRNHFQSLRKLFTGVNRLLRVFCHFAYLFKITRSKRRFLNRLHGIELSFCTGCYIRICDNIRNSLVYVGIVTGHILRNFRFILNVLLQGNAVATVTNDAELLPQLTKLIADGELRKELGQRAGDIIRQHAGATDRTVAYLEDLLK